MKVKVVPRPPESLDDVAGVRDALPRVPRSEHDCCARLADRVEWIDDRDAAREWLAFLAAVGLATRTGEGSYVRSEARSTNDDGSGGAGSDGTGSDGAESGGAASDGTGLGGAESDGSASGGRGSDSGRFDGVDRDALAAGLRDGVFAAGPVLDALDADEPRDATAALAAIESDLPTWERRRRPDAAAIWRERTERLLEWWVLAGEAVRADGEYVRADG